MPVQLHLGIEPTEISMGYKVAARSDGTIVQIYAPRVYRGVRVRDSYVTATINTIKIRASQTCCRSV